MNIPLGLPAMGWHFHIGHALIGQDAQLAYESIDELVLLPTHQWPHSPDDEIDFVDEERVGIDEVLTAPRRYRPQRQAWRDDPAYVAFLKRYPELRTASRGRPGVTGSESILAFFALTNSEADVWSMDAAGYTREWIGGRLGFKPGGVDQLLESAVSKVQVKLHRLDRSRVQEEAS